MGLYSSLRKNIRGLSSFKNMLSEHHWQGDGISNGKIWTMKLSCNRNVNLEGTVCSKGTLVRKLLSPKELFI